MIRLTLALGLFSLIACGGCKSDDLLAGLADAAPVDGGVCGADPTTHPPVYINRNPTTIRPGDDDSLVDTSSLVTGAATTSGSSMTDPAFADLLTCLSGLLSPFGVTVVDQAPAVEHLEIVITDSPDELPLGSLGAIAPLTCGQNRRALAFSFPTGGDRYNCESVAVVIGYLAGASPSRQCYDIMNLLNVGCDDEFGGSFDPNRPKSFTDEEDECGQDQAVACSCTGELTQNTYRIVGDFFAGYCEGGR